MFRSLFWFVMFYLAAIIPEKMVAQQVNYLNSEDDLYYLGINPIAPFTSIRSTTTSLYFPYMSNQETGIALFVGKIWNRHYNVETRLSFGSPATDINLFQVHSGFNYLLRPGKCFHPYAGVFLKIYSLHHMVTKTDQVSGIGYLSIGNRFKWKRYFLDLRLSENIYALKWSSIPGSKAQSGFHNSIYKWESPYIPYATLGLGYMFR